MIYTIKITIMSLFILALILNAFYIPLIMSVPVAAAVGLFVGFIMEVK